MNNILFDQTNIILFLIIKEIIFYQTKVRKVKFSLKEVQYLKFFIIIIL